LKRKKLTRHKVEKKGKKENRDMKKQYVMLLTAALTFNTAMAQTDSGAIELEPANKGNSLNITKTGGNGYIFETTGGDPHVGLKGSSAFEKEKTYVLMFEYTDLENNGVLNVYMNVNGLKRKDVSLEKADRWTKAYVDLTDGGNAYESAIKNLRIDTPPAKGASVKIRNLRVVEATKKLLQRCAIGDMVDILDTLGIEPGDLTADQCGTETVRYSDDSSSSMVKSVYGHLDFDARTKKASMKAHNKALVPLGPVIVAGEGEHPDNHTVVRIFSKYQVQESQFLAFAPEVRGGVGINSVALGADKYGFVCHPLTDKNTNTVKLFNRYGGLIQEINVDGIQPPFIVAAGDFYKGNEGAEIAVTSRYSRDVIALYSTQGEKVAEASDPLLSKLSSLLFGGKSDEEYHLTSIKNDGGADQLVYQDITTQELQVFDGESGFDSFATDATIPENVKVFSSAFQNKKMNAGGKQDIVSTLYSVTQGGKTIKQDAGLRENTFFYAVHKTHGGAKDPWPDFPDSKYIRNAEDVSLFQSQCWSPVAKSGNIKNVPHQKWLEGMNWETRGFIPFPEVRRERSIEQYGEGKPGTWNLNFTHRWRISQQKKLMDRIGEKGLPEYLCLNRKNETLSNGYFGQNTFTYGSYNFEQPELQNFYHLVQWEFHKRLAVPYRKDPEHLTIVKPSHENEVNSEAGSMGDYNLHNIRGFYRYLLALYGNLDAINRKFGTTFTDTSFDAPRDALRGEWDKYSYDNPFYNEWIEYSRVTVYRRVGEAQLGALLAGIPPQLLRTHQVPSKFITRQNMGEDDPIRRISPVDWFMTAGTGMGYTRYRTWYKNKHTMAEGAWTSGFDDYYNGEYTSKTGDPQEAWEQLEFAISKGLKGALVMAWPDPEKIGYNTTMISALKRLHEEYGDTPLPGLAGGISQVRAYKGKEQAYDIAALGCTENNTGLIKSLAADGSFEGTLYLSPFHSRVAVDTLLEKDAMQVGRKAEKLCDLKDIRQGCVVEVNFTVADEQKVKPLEVNLFRNNVRLPEFKTVLDNVESGKNIRVVYKFPIIMDDISIVLSSPELKTEIKNLKVYRHQDMAMNLSRNIWTGERHKGGVTFDVIPE